MGVTQQVQGQRILPIDTPYEDCDSAQFWETVGGLENAHSGNCAASGAADDSPLSIDAELQAIIQRWPDLPDAVKTGVAAMVRAVSQ